MKNFKQLNETPEYIEFQLNVVSTISICRKRVQSVRFHNCTKGKESDWRVFNYVITLDDNSVYEFGDYELSIDQQKALIQWSVMGREIRHNLTMGKRGCKPYHVFIKEEDGLDSGVHVYAASKSHAKLLVKLEAIVRFETTVNPYDAYLDLLVDSSTQIPKILEDYKKGVYSLTESIYKNTGISKSQPDFLKLIEIIKQYYLI